MNTKPGAINPAKIEVSRHFAEQVVAKGFTKAQVLHAVTHPVKVTPVTRYPGQWRWCGGDIAVVMAPLGGGRWKAVTAYLDGVRTSLRPDQYDDPAALASTRALR